MPRRDVSHIGRYEIQHRLGVGGMGALYLARDPSLDRLVAIKLLKEDLQDLPGLRERFIREARSVARLRHPNIVIVYDVGEDDGRPFMAMEYIAGETLDQVLRRTPSLPVARRLELVEDLCAGLAHAHAVGIIHRDIKPANIMLDGDGVLKILDFGIARIVNSGMTQEGMMMGTLSYMSPEQVAGRGVDRATDIFATGAVLYEVIALEQAFPGGLDTGILKRIVSDGPVPLEQKVPGIDPELAAIVRRALEPDVGRRYQDATALRQDLTRVRRRLVESGQFAPSSVERETALFEPPKPTPVEPGPKVESDRPKRLSPERFAELRRQQVEEHLRFGEEAFARGEHDAALHYAERAATVDPDSHAAIDLIDKARLAIEGKAIRQLLGESQRLLVEGHLDEAAALAEEASATLPDIHGAADLRREVRQAVEKIAAIRQREQRIASTLGRAQQSLDQGAYDTALRAIYEALALDPERPQARDLEQQAKRLLESQREHERARRTAYGALARAESLSREGQYDAALAEIAAVAAPSDTVRVAADAALTAVRNAQCLALHEAILARAKAALDRGDLAEAQSAIDSIPEGERTARARALQGEVAKALEAQRQLERKQQALEVALKTIEGLVEQSNLTRALEHLEEAAAIGLDDPRIAALRGRITDLIAEAERKKQQEARDRVAAKRVEAAQRLLASGDGHAAIALLDRDGSGHPLVEQALRDIRVAVAEQEERVRKEVERRRQEEEARRQAEAERRRQEEEARRQAEAERRHQEEEARRLAEAEALRKVEEQRRVEGERRAEERRRQQEEERRQQEERRQKEEQRQKQREQVATLILSAERALAARRPEEATFILESVDQHVVSAEDDLGRRAAAARSEAERLLREQQEEKRSQEAEAQRREEERRQEEEKRRKEVEARRREDERRQQEARREQEERRAREERDRQQAEADAARLREQQRIEEEHRRREEAEREAKRLEAARAESPRQAEKIAVPERERIEQQARDAQAWRMGERARQLFASGQHDEALALLRGAHEHPTLRGVIEELEVQLEEIQRQRERREHADRRREKSAAAALALRKAAVKRRLWVGGSVVLSVTIALLVWQFLSAPTSPPEVALVSPPPSAPPASSTNTDRTPAPGQPAGPGTSPAAGGRGTTAVPPVSAPPLVSTEAEEIVVVGRSNPPPEQKTPVQPATPPGSPPVTDGTQKPQAPTGPPISVNPVPTPTPVTPRPVPTPPRVDLAAERAAIQQLLNRYVAAYHDLDEDRLREIDPSFQNIANRVLLKSLELRMSDVVIDVAPDGQSGSLTARQNFSYTWNRSRMPPSGSGNLRWPLRKVDGNWKVVR